MIALVVIQLDIVPEFRRRLYQKPAGSDSANLGKTKGISVAERIADARLTPIRYAEINVASSPAPTDERMRRIVATSADDPDLSFKFMPSGAGHDVQDMALITPTGMIFVPSVKGISHSPKEFTSAQDMANGASVLLRTVLEIDGGAL